MGTNRTQVPLCVPSFNDNSFKFLPVKTNIKNHKKWQTSRLQLIDVQFYLQNWLCYNLLLLICITSSTKELSDPQDSWEFWIIIFIHQFDSIDSIKPFAKKTGNRNFLPRLKSWAQAFSQPVILVTHLTCQHLFDALLEATTFWKKIVHESSQNWKCMQCNNYCNNYFPNLFSEIYSSTIELNLNKNYFLQYLPFYVDHSTDHCWRHS